MKAPAYTDFIESQSRRLFLRVLNGAHWGHEWVQQRLMELAGKCYGEAIKDRGWV